MDSVLDVCKEQLRGWDDSIDRLRVGGVLRGLQQAGAVVNFMKASYPGEERPLRHFPELTGRLTAGVERLVRQGIPYLEAGWVSDPAVQTWLEPFYAARPRAGSIVAIVRTIEWVNSFSCRRRAHPRATGHPTTGRRTTDTAEHHLSRGQHHICVYYFPVFDAHWGRASVRVASYLPFEITLQLNGHDYLERQMGAASGARSPWRPMPWPTWRTGKRCARSRGSTWNPRSAGSPPTGWPASPTA